MIAKKNPKTVDSKTPTINRRKVAKHIYLTQETWDEISAIGSRLRRQGISEVIEEMTITARFLEASGVNPDSRGLRNLINRLRNKDGV